MRAMIAHIGDRFSLRHLMIGMLVAMMACGSAFGWVWLKYDTLLTTKQDSLSVKTVDIRRAKRVENEVTGEYMSLSAIDVYESGLAKSPIPGLFIDTDKGKLPIIRKADGLTPFESYKRPFDLETLKGPAISLALYDVGLSAKDTADAIKALPPEVSFIFSTYTEQLGQWVERARMGGHEVWLMLPTEPDLYPFRDPGPNTLLVSASAEQNARRLEIMLGLASGYVGFVGNADSALIASDKDMKPILNEIFLRGLGYVDSRVNPPSFPMTFSTAANAYYTANDIWIDDLPRPEQIERNLQSLTEIAKSKKIAVGMLHAYPVSFNMVAKWAEGLKAKGFTLIPLTAAASQ